MAGGGAAEIHPAERHRRQGTGRAVHEVGRAPPRSSPRSPGSKAAGPSGVYFTELFNQPGLSGATIQQALAQAGREVDSDFELASLLIASNRLVTDDGARRAYLEAARTIGSDFELRRVLSSIVKAGPMTPAIAASVLDTSGSIDSDFEQASLLAEFAARQPLDGPAGAAFFKALAGVSSSFEHNRVLKAVLQRTDLSEQARVAALESAAAIESDFEAASFLLQFVKTSGVEGCGARAVLPRGGVDRLGVRARPRAAGARRGDRTSPNRPCSRSCARRRR